MIEFEYSQQQLSDFASHALDRVLSLGGTSAAIVFNENINLASSVREDQIDNVTTSYESGFSLSVYVDNKKSNINIGKINPCNLDDLIKRALEIANCIQSDEFNGIPQAHLLCTKLPDIDLQLNNPQHIAFDELIDRAKNIESIGCSDSRIIGSDGASIECTYSQFLLANTNGINLGYASTNYSSSLSLIGKCADGSMQTDYWFDNACKYSELLSDHDLAGTALKRTLRRLNKGQIKSGSMPVIFESSVAVNVIGNLLYALNGSNIFRQLSFLNNSLNESLLPSWVDIVDDPYIISGPGSCYFDGEGVKVAKKNIIKNGVINSYLLNCYYARKLDLEPTGNASGAHNIIVSHNFHGDIFDLAKKMSRGLIVVDTIGSGVNIVTGDYSVGASGLWVENGAVQFFVDNITIAGNLRDVYKNIIHIADDFNSHSSVRCGSMLVDGVSVSI